jgi:CheY-like chemotaxis protein
MLRDAKPWTTPTVLVLDIAMPGDDGFSVLTRVRGLERLPFIPAIAVTALTYLDRRQFTMAGFQNCLGKPVDVECLIETIATVAGRSGSAVG